MSKGGKEAPQSHSVGFTIVEVLIVLAVSSALLVTAYALVSGRQKRTQFTTSINDTRQQLQQIINETTSGYFPASDQFVCQDPGTQQPVTFKAAGAADPGGQGSNQGCVFLGKSIQFGLDVTDPGQSQLAVVPVVGRQTWNSLPIKTLAQAIPRAAWPEGADPMLTDPSGAAAIAALKGLSQGSVHSIQYGLHIANNSSACHGAHIPGVGAPVIPTPPEAPPTNSFGTDPPVCFLPTGKADTAANYVATGMMAVLFGDNAGNISSFDSSNNLQSGLQQMSLYGVGPNKSNGTNTSNSAGESIAAAADHLGDSPSFVSASGSQGNLMSAAKLKLCIDDDATNQSGLFTISGDGSFTISLDIQSNKTCQ